MNQKNKKLASLFGFAAFVVSVGAVSAYATDLDKNDYSTMNSACQTLDTQDQVASCVEPFYKAAMAQAQGIWQDIHKNGIPDIQDMSEYERREYEEGSFTKRCESGYDPHYTEDKTPESFLRDPQWCLSYATSLADKFDIDYNRDKAAFLIHRSRMLRHVRDPSW